MKLNAHNLKDFLKVDRHKDWHAAKAMLTQKPVNAYIGWTGHGNLGDEAVYEAYLELMHDPSLKSMRIIGAMHRASQGLRRDIPVGYAALGGGTLINQSGLWLQQVQYFLSKGVPVFCMGTGVASSSFWNDRPELQRAGHIAEWAEALKQFVFVGVRGPQSLQTLKDVGVQAKIVGDAAIALAPSKVTRRTGGKTIGINVSFGTDNAMHGDPQRMVAEVAKAAGEFVKQGFTINLLPIWHEDVPACEAITQSVNSPTCTIVRAYSSTQQYLAAVNECDLFIGLKLHATIFSTMLRIPSVMLEYRPKCMDYMASINQADFSVRTDIVTAELLAEKIATLQQTYDQTVATLDKQILHYKQLQTKEVSALKPLLHI